ncbi:hypothetical protein BGX27_005247 [Mortierella sp. AM989]|nr:hypothetical protein BGX27_005247 [Mortierella sp. AM989]
MGDEVDKKPEAGSAEHINLKVVGQDQSEVFFKIKRSTQLKKLMEAYCERQGKAVASVRFLYDGDRIQPTNTPNELEMEDGDSIDVMVEQWAKHQRLVNTYVRHYHKNSKDQQPQEKTYETERDILVKNHRFLRSEEDDQDLTWEKRLAKKYYDKLFKEYALVELKHYKEGRIAMRWRNEKELFCGKGQFTCGSLRCDDSEGLQSWEVNFGYMEQGEKKNALVKIRLCERCSIKLNYKTKHKRTQSLQDESTSSSSIPKSPERKSRRSPSDDRSKLMEKEAVIKGDNKEGLNKTGGDQRKRGSRHDVSDGPDDTPESHERPKKKPRSHKEGQNETGNSGLSKASLNKTEAFFEGLFD